MYVPDILYDTHTVLWCSVAMLCTIALLHYCTIALLHYCTIALLHYCTIALLHYCTIALLHYCTIALLHYCTIALLLCATVSLFHCFLVALFVPNPTILGCNKRFFYYIILYYIILYSIISYYIILYYIISHLARYRSQAWQSFLETQAGYIIASRTNILGYVMSLLLAELSSVLYISIHTL